MNERLKFVDLKNKFMPFAKQFHQDLDRVISSGDFILGKEVRKLEKSIERMTPACHAVGVANCTDGLILGLKAIGISPGDEVITSPMSYLATTSTIALCGGCPVFVDIDETLNIDPMKIEMAITPRTKAISVVHLAGVPAKIKQIVDIGSRHGIPVIEDCAQSFGATLDGKLLGSFGNFGVMSFHPLKTFGTVGDGGLILAKDSQDFKWLVKARNHGHSSREECDFWSLNSRLDEIHAAFLNTLLKYYPNELKRRQQLAGIYRKNLKHIVDFPSIAKNGKPSYNWVMILSDKREDLILHLKEQGVETKIHYSKLIPDLLAASDGCRIHGHIDNARRQVDRILSLPTAEHISNDNAHFICKQIIDFYQSN